MTWKTVFMTWKIALRPPTNKTRSKMQAIPGTWLNPLDTWPIRIITRMRD